MRPRPELASSLNLNPSMQPGLAKVHLEPSPIRIQNSCMPNVITRPGWYLPEKFVTPEGVYKNRRTFLQQVGFSSAGIFMGALGTNRTLFAQDQPATSLPAKKTYPFPRN